MTRCFQRSSSFRWTAFVELCDLLVSAAGLKCDRVGGTSFSSVSIRFPTTPEPSSEVASFVLDLCLLVTFSFPFVMLVEEATTSLEGSLDIVGFAFGGSSSATISSSCSDISCAVSTGFEGFLSATTALGPGRPEATCFLGGARAFELGGRADPLYKTSSSCFRI